jgi:hypothetical protein
MEAIAAGLLGQPVNWRAAERTHFSISYRPDGPEQEVNILHNVDDSDLDIHKQPSHIDGGDEWGAKYVQG